MRIKGILHLMGGIILGILCAYFQFMYNPCYGKKSKYKEFGASENIGIRP